ncbi:hypothetical protein GCM10009612_15780 [Streptomyces beijiangensis]
MSPAGLDRRAVAAAHSSFRRKYFARRRGRITVAALSGANLIGLRPTGRRSGKWGIGAHVVGGVAEPVRELIARVLKEGA